MQQQQLLLVVLLVLGSAAVLAAAAPVGLQQRQAAAARAADPGAVRITSSLAAPAEAVPISPQECPGIEANGAVCGKACQLRLCNALADFYKTTNNLTDPWDNEFGWELTATMPCQRLVDGSPRQAVYCSWYGVECCTPQGMADRRCAAVNTVIALELTINNLNASVEDPALLRSLKSLHDCGMRVLNLEANNLIGALPDAWGSLNKLLVFNLGNSWLSGTLPDGLRRMRNVTLINLANNWINGTLPAWVAELTELRVLNLGSNQGGNMRTAGDGADGGEEEEEMLGLLGSIPKGLNKLTKLRELNLEANSLTGELPRDLCQGDNSSLLLLNVRGNKLEGDAQGVQDCGGLVQLDISQNRFAGSLPASTDWDELATYRAGSNSFSGQFPMNLTAARILEHLDISNNQLTGIIPPQIVLLSSLKTFVVASNKFSGTVNENIYYLPALAKLDLSNNTLVGTTPQAIGLAYGLQELDFSNNPGLTGMMPPQMGLLARLKQIHASDTNMSCAGIISPYVVTTNNSCADPKRCTTPVMLGSPDTRYQPCTEETLLPCFLRFSEYMIPRDDDSNMRCKYILRRPVEDAREACWSDQDTGLGTQAAQLPELGSDRLGQIWQVDPSYFQFRVCECLLGYKGVWEGNGTVLTCHAESHQTPTAIIVGVVAAAAVLIIGLLAWWQYLTTRPRWLRERILQAKRSRGAPKVSKPGEKVTVSIVVTDVKDFSDLTRRYPVEMNKAMGIHNNILRKASHNHAGYIMDQEGDSWTVAFHDAEDAVAFSLQVQQALSQRSWGKLRVGNTHELTDLTGMRDDVASARFSHAHQSLNSATQVQRSSSSFGFMGEDLSTHGELGAKGLDSFIAGHKINTSFSASSAGRASSVERSFTLPRNAPPSDSGTPSHNAGSLAAAAAAGAPLANGHGNGGGPGLPGGSTGAAVATADAKLGSTHQQHQPDQRQVSFSDAVPGRDGTPSAQRGQQHQQQLQLLRLLRCNSDEQLVQPSGNSGNSWPDEPSVSHAGVGAKSAFDLSLQPVQDNRLNSLSITAASRAGRSSSSGSRLWSAGAAVIRRMSVFGRSGLLSTSMRAPADPGSHAALHVSVRIGIATGRLPYGCDLNNCAVKDRAKNYVSDVANGGQILLDENTFRAIKDSLSVLGTVNEGGYDDRQLQQLLHSRVVNRLQHHMLCGACGCSGVGEREASFSSGMQTRDIQDYDNDALVVHMGAFEPPAERQHVQQQQQQHKHAAAVAAGTTSDSSAPSTPSGEDAEAGGKPLHVSSKDVAAGADGVADAAEVVRVKANGRGVGSRKAKVLNLYAIAAPGMRRVPTTTRDITQCLSWGAPVDLKRHWSKVQKGYFDAPGARSIDLAPSAQCGDQAALPEVVIVFVQVLGGSSFSYKRHRSETHALKKAITRCMLQVLDDLPETEEGRDGYLCRCQEADLKYMVSFKTAHMALQWCMLVQEALMYFSWPDSILVHPGFEEVLDPISGLPLFRGPRLRMGFAVGQPNSVLPDHTGRANYYGHSVNRAARFMEAAAHGGQIVTDVDTARKLFRAWARGDGELQQDGGASTPSRAYSDADVHPRFGPDLQQELSQDSALLQMLVNRSQSETTGHCRPSAARVPLSRLALRQQQQQTGWLQQLQPPHQARDARLPAQQQLSLPLTTISNNSKESFSTPLPDVQPLPEHLESPVPLSARLHQQQQQQGTMLPVTGEGSFTRRQNLLGGSASMRPSQVSASGGSFTRMQVAPSGGSFSRRQQQQQQLAAGVQGALAGYPQGASMSASFSTRRKAAAAGSGDNHRQQPQQQQQQALPEQARGSSLSFTMQVPCNWQQSAEAGEVYESVCVTHLGTFSFKGSGVYDMVVLLPAALVGRQFPEDAPKGKGYRVMVAEGPVAGIEPVMFCIPPWLAAARQAFLARRHVHGGVGSVADTD